MDKLKMHSPDLSQENIAKIRELFPNCVTEARDEKTGKLRLAVDFDLLRQELSDHIVEGPQERYRLDWPGKREALALANVPIAKTLRSSRDESVDFDKTKNLFIEGDNLEALKILQTPMLGKVKLIYIDPPYNTGNDFVYDDDFSEDASTYFEKSNQTSDVGERLVANTESNGRFHSDWLTMIYPRLKVARSLISDDGAIFISVDEGEKANLRRICDEIFGEENYRNTILVRRRVKSLNSQFADNGLYSMNVGFEYVLIYAKSRNFLMNALRMKKKNAPSTGTWNVFWSGADRPTMRYELLGFTPETGQWRWQKEKALEGVANYEKYINEFSDKMSLEDYWRRTGEKLKFVRRIENGMGKNGGVQYWISPSDTALRSSNWTDIEVSQIRKDYDLPFENPKSVDLMMELIRLINDIDFTVMDFFAGSATTADAVLRLNAEDGGRRRFVMVQIPEPTPEGSAAKQAGFKNLSEISKERIRLAGNTLIEGESHPDWNRDVGFRVLKVDTSNMKDVYYRPDELKQSDLLDMVDNVKEDRTAEDLLFQVLLDWGVDLTLPIRRETVQGKTVFFVDDNALVACFDMGVTEDLVKELAKHEPLRVVFRDNGFVSDAVKINVEQIFRQLSPTTEVKAI
jgi:adenine-specific DNA-methyltransferase